jgi:RimJ/RimL family protein N-acetyltransferase
LVFEPFAAELARAIVDGDRSDDWAEDFPFEGEVVVAGLILAAESHVEPPTRDRPWGFWVIRRRAVDEGVVGALIGGVGFKSAPRDGRAEIGYGLVPSARGFGFASEAVEAMCQASEQLGVRVWAETELGNIASERVLVRCGFTRTSRADEISIWSH